MRVPGAVLPPGDGDGLKVDLRSEGDGDSRLQITPGTGKDAVCGTIVLPWLAPDGTLRTFRYRVPPPEPWRSTDLDAMWRASTWLRLARELNAPELLDERTSIRRRAAINWEALDATLGIARALLRRWPTTNQRRLRRAPIDLPAGIEDGPATERELGAAMLPAVMGPSGPMAAAAVYITRHAPPWQSQRLHAALSGLLGLLEEAVAPHVRAGGLPPELLATLAPLRAVAERVKDPRRLPERQPSSWPVLARQLLGATLQASHTTGQTRGPGADRAPACRVWQVYEDWVLERTCSLMRRLLGPAVPGRALFPMRWILPDDTEVELHAQPVITWKKPEVFGERHLVAVVGAALRPDVVLVVTRPGEGSRLLIVDAKAYSAGLEHETVAGEASKYLWGLRDAPGPSALLGGAPAVDEVVLVAPLGGPTPLAPREASQTACIAAAPHLPQPATNLASEALNSGTVRGWLDRLGLR